MTLPLWWLSFNRANGERIDFAGVCIVEAPNSIAAIDKAWDLGINPGGELAMLPVPPGAIAPEYHDRLLTRDEVKLLSSVFA